MIDNKPLNTTLDVSLVKKIILFLNVCAYRLGLLIPSASSYGKDYRSASFSAVFLVLIECATGKYLFGLSSGNLFYLVIAGVFIHSAIVIFFYKSVDTMANNFSAYYFKGLFYLFVLFAVFGVVCGAIYLNSRIGHLPANYNKYH